MNMARARRRWQRMRRWEDRVIKLCGDAHKCIPSEHDTYNEHAIWYNSGHHLPTRRGWRINRHHRISYRWSSYGFTPKQLRAAADAMRQGVGVDVDLDQLREEVNRDLAQETQSQD